MEVWVSAAALFVAWLVCALVFGKGGFIHILLLAAVSTAFAKLLQERRTGRR